MSASKESSCNVDVYRLFYVAYTLGLSYFHCAKKGQIQPASRSFKKGLLLTMELKQGWANFSDF